MGGMRLVAACLAYFLRPETREWPQLVGGMLRWAAVLLLQTKRNDARRLTTTIYVAKAWFSACVNIPDSL